MVGLKVSATDISQSKWRPDWRDGIADRALFVLPGGLGLTLIPTWGLTTISNSRALDLCASKTPIHIKNKKF